MEIQLFTPHKKQREVFKLLEENRYVLLNIGRQWGKTTMAHQWLLKQVLENNNTIGAWISPTWKQAKKVFETLTTLTEKAPFIKSVSKLNNTIYFVNNSKIVFFTAENYETIRGNSLDWIVGDEAAFYREDAWYKAIQPTQAAKPNSKCLLISTPNGKNYWYKLFMDAKNIDNWVSVKYPSSTSPYVDGEYLKMAKKSLPEIAYKQEILAEFVEGASELFRNVEDCAVLAPKQANGKRLYAGIDVAFAHDYTVCVIFNDNYEMVDFIRFNDQKKNFQKAATKLYQFLKSYNFPQTYIEINQYDSVYTFLKQFNTPRLKEFKTTASNKPDIVNHLVSLFANKDIKIINDPNILEEFYNFKYKLNPSGKISYEAEQGFHDDIVMATAICLHQLKNKKKIDSKRVMKIKY